jgi:PadR family transcriptional regulator, regulatory protein AphA
MDVRTICLGILTRGDATGYEIKKLFEDGRYHYFVEASFGSIYPALSKLTEDRLVSVREEAQAKRPDRKVYSITPEGRRAFLDALLGDLPEDRFRSPFLFAMMFSDTLPEGRTGHMLDEHIARIEATLALLEKDCACNSKGEAFVCDFGRMIYATILEYLRRRRSEFDTAGLKAAE